MHKKYYVFFFITKSYIDIINRYEYYSVLSFKMLSSLCSYMFN